jgi:hypothetical protein
MDCDVALQRSLHLVRVAAHPREGLCPESDTKGLPLRTCLQLRQHVFRGRHCGRYQARWPLTPARARRNAPAVHAGSGYGALQIWNVKLGLQLQADAPRLIGTRRVGSISSTAAARDLSFGHSHPCDAFAGCSGPSIRPSASSESLFGSGEAQPTRGRLAVGCGNQTIRRLPSASY